MILVLGSQEMKQHLVLGYAAGLGKDLRCGNGYDWQRLRCRKVGCF